MTVRLARFRRTCPDGVSTKYDLGSSAWAVTRPGDRWLPVVTQTCVSFGMMGSGFVPCRVS